MDDIYDRDCVTRGIRLLWSTLARVRNMELYTGEIDYLISNPRGGLERIFSIHLPTATAPERIQELIIEIRSGHLPQSILIPFDPEPPNLVDLLLQNGFCLDTSGLCMVMNLADLSEAHQTTGEIQVIVVETPEQLRQWVDIVNVAFSGEEVMSYERFHDLYCLDQVIFFLASDRGNPAAVAMIVMDHDFASLEFVATLKDHRHRGLGSALTVTALYTMKSYGVKMATLRAEPDGINIYRKAGFREVCPRVLAFLPASEVSSAPHNP